MPAPELQKRPVWWRVEWVGLRDGLPYEPVKQAIVERSRQCPRFWGFCADSWATALRMW